MQQEFVTRALYNELYAMLRAAEARAEGAEREVKALRYALRQSGEWKTKSQAWADGYDCGRDASGGLE